MSHEVQKLANVNITDILWNDFSLDYLFRLAEMKAELTGVINLKQDSANMPNFAQKRAMLEAFGDIDDPDNKLYVTYRVMRLPPGKMEYNNKQLRRYYGRWSFNRKESRRGRSCGSYPYNGIIRRRGNIIY